MERESSECVGEVRVGGSGSCGVRCEILKFLCGEVLIFFLTFLSSGKFLVIDALLMLPSQMHLCCCALKITEFLLVAKLVS